MKELLSLAISKLFSGRFLILVTSIGTYCYVLSRCLDMVAHKTLGVETFLGLFAGLASIVGTIVTFYFMRTDRNTEGNATNDNKTGQ
jgi:spore maturation protein SpmB